MDDISPKKLYNLAVKRESENNREEAVEYYKKAVEKDPKMIQGWLNLGSLQMRMGNLEEAISSLKTALRLDKRLIQAHLILAQIYKELGKNKQIEIYLTNAYRIDPKNKYALGALAIFYFDNERYIESLEMVEKYLKLYPDEKNLRILKTEILAKQGNYKQSLSELTDLVQKDAGFLSFQNSVRENISDPELRQHFESLAKKTKEKLHEFKAKLELSKENPEDFLPPDPQDAMDLSLMYLFQGDAEKAMQYLVYARKINQKKQES